MKSEERSHDDFLQDMVVNARRAIHFMGTRTLEEFQKDEMVAYAVVRALEIVGEAARKIPDSTRAQYPTIPWKLIVGMRHRIVHDYMNIQYLIVWNTVRDDLPILLQALHKFDDDQRN